MTTKIPAELSSTPGIIDSSNATAITIDSSENTTTSGTFQVGASSGANLKFSESSDVISITAKKDGTDDIDLAFHTQASGGVTGERMRINSSGNITKPDNCSFSARHSTTVSNFSIGSYVQVPFDTEIYDNGSNLASSGTFTAPVTGRYLLCATVRFGSVDASATYSRIVIATSNRSYQGTLLDHSVLFSGDADYHVYFAHFIADMDANDTANVNFYQLNGSAQADLAGDESFFQGELIG